MAHKLLNFDPIESPRKSFWGRIRAINPPNITGKFGFSLYLGPKEIFIGISINDVIEEQVIKKRYVKVPKASVKVYKFDSL